MNQTQDWGPLKPLRDRQYANPQQEVRPRKRRSSIGRWGTLGAIAIALLGKAKWLLAGLKFLKFGTLLSMLVTVGAYAMFFGWPYAVGFVLLIFVHEMGHAVALKRQGIPAGAPVFVPFMGAFIAMKGRPRDAWVEAYVGIGGPLLGTVAAIACLGVALATGSALWFALASVGFLLNLFNMIPISPLDGGRIAGAISRWFWVVGYAIGIGLVLLTWHPILILILLLGTLTLYSSWKRPVEGYYDISALKRVGMGAAYFALLAVMVLGMGFADSYLRELLPAQQIALLVGPWLTVFGGALFDRLTERSEG